MESLAKKDLQKKIEYIGLDFDDIPDELIEFNPLEFNVSRLNNDKDHRVFRYVPIDKIDILITPSLRSDPLKDKYSKSLPLHKYILPAESEEDIEKYTTFLKMLNTVSIDEIENIIDLQNEVENKEPFKVKYNRDHLWQIYYSEKKDRYFMLVCSKEKTFAEFFYLLKAKIKFLSGRAKIAPKIYVPINSINYSEEFLDRNEIADLENYLWLITKNWALIFEVYNKQNKLSLQVTGETIVYDDVKSYYKVKLNSKEEAIKFYKLLKALFILQTEIKNKFNFTTKVDSNGSLEFYMGEKRLAYEDLAEFIKTEFKIAEEEIKVQNDNIILLKKELENIKELVKSKEDEYLLKQKEISTYLEYKKTFIGKVKYFFKSSKINQKIQDDIEVKAKLKEEFKEENDNDYITNIEAISISMQNKKYYTIEDLVTIYSVFEKGERNHKNLNQDLKAQRLKLENLVSKVRNASLYIEEIDKHKKSIFDFWKFSNKDEKLSLEMGNEDEEENSKNALKKVFDYKNDFENLGIDVDTKQRKKLSKEEMDSLYIAKTDILYLLNMIRENDLNKYALQNKLEELKEEFNSKRLNIDSETFDIFGNTEDDNRKFKYIGNRGHRENEKSKFKILNINKKIDVFDFTEKLQSILNYLEGAVPKLKAEYDFSLYKVAKLTEKVKPEAFDIYNIDPESALEEYNDEDEDGALNLIKLNYKEGLPLLYYSNIVFYDNNNKTLPVGMDLSSSVLLDCKRLDFKIAGKHKFRTNMYFDSNNNSLTSKKVKDIYVYEYDVELKQ